MEGNVRSASMIEPSSSGYQVKVGGMHKGREVDGK